MKLSYVGILTFAVFACASLQGLQAAPRQAQKKAVCTGTLDTGSGMAGSRVGDAEGKTCFIDADSASEHAVQEVCKSGSQCQVTAMVTAFKNGNMQIQKVISVKQISAAPE